MPVSKTRNKDRSPKKPADSKKVEQKAERKRSERAMQVGFTNKWSFLWWTLPALGFGVGVQAAYNAIGGYAGETPSVIQVMIAFFCIAVVTAVPTFLLVLGVARSAFTMRSIKETIKRFSFKGKWLEALLLSLIAPIFLSCMLSVTFPSGEDMAQWSWLVLVASTFFPINNALKLAYREQYLEITLDDGQLKKMKEDREAYKALSLKEKFKQRSKIKNIIGSHDKMLLPTLQTLIVWFLPSVLISLGVIAFAENNQVSDQQFEQVSQALSPFSFLVLMLTTFIWSKWHLYGGIGRISRFTEGRPLEPIY